MKKSITLLFLAFYISGCASTYTYNGTTYSSRNDAVNAIHNFYSRNMDYVSESTSEKNGSALFVFPTRFEYLKNGLINPHNTNEDGRQYLVDTMEINAKYLFDAVKKSQLFNKVDLQRTSLAKSPSFSGYDYIIWQYLPNPQQTSWYVQRKDGSRSNLGFDFGTNQHLRIQSWVNSLKLALKNANKGPIEGGKRTPSTSSGTGFFINQHGYGLTNAHVVSNCSDITLKMPNQQTSKITLIKADQINDIAIFKSDIKPTSYGKLRSTKSIKAGEPVSLYGFPLISTLSTSGNVTSGNVSALTGIRDDSRFFQITAPVQPGNSGGPLFDDKGNVIGIVTEKLNALYIAAQTGDIPQNVNFSLKNNLIINFLDTNNIPYSSTINSQIISLVDLTEKAKEFTGQILCN
ncbi:S1C family serine protease [Terasakiella pusilla]|uniref:S1C family serine protease n=1 Tax=Terasakiella pusilla TaxID=64973 RepID=UPI003AA93B73